MYRDDLVCKATDCENNQNGKCTDSQNVEIDKESMCTNYFEKEQTNAK